MSRIHRQWLNWVSFVVTLTCLAEAGQSGSKPTEKRKVGPDIAHSRDEDSAASVKPLRLKDFHKDLGRNFVALFSTDNVTPLVIGLASVGVVEFDDNAADFFGRGSRFGRAEAILGHYPGTSWVIGGAIGTMVLISRNRGDEKFRQMSYSLSQGFVLNGLLTSGIKTAVGRERPDGSNSRSFPSGHASQAFAFATIFSHYHKKATIPAYLAAGFVGASRLDQRKHFVSDVVAGAALGYLVGRTVVRQADKKTKVFVSPFVAPSRDEIGVSVRAVF